MKQQDRKLEILHVLSQELEPIRLSDLVKKLPNIQTDQKTVRRLLNVLVEEGRVLKSGSTKATKYLAINKTGFEKKPREIEANSCFGPESLEIIAKLKRPQFERYPSSYNEAWFDSYVPNHTFYLPIIVQEQLFKAGRRASDQDPAGTYAHQIFNRLLIDLSYNSSRLEGNTYSLLDTERLILYGDTPDDKLDEEKIMILNHKEAIRYLVDNAPKISVNQKIIFMLHYLLADGLLEPRYAGKVRDHSVRITGSSYLPFENPKKLEKQLTAIAEKASIIENPFEQSIFLLIHVSYLQAFSDVNKRTARLSANIPLITKNLVPLSFNDVDRSEYALALIAIYELQDVRPMVDLFIFSYMRTCSAYDSTVKALGYDAIRVRFRFQRRAVIRIILLEKLVGEALEVYINKKALQGIPEEYQKEFIEDIREDLDQMDESRTIGMGITPDQLSKWLNLYKKS